MAGDPQRRRRLGRWGRGLVALVLLAGVGTVVAFQAAIHWIVERELTRTLDARVRIEQLRVFPLAGRLTVAGLTIHEKTSRQPLLRVQGVDMRVLPISLWHREILVTHLTLEQPEAWLTLTPEGFSWLPFTAPADNGSSRLAVSVREFDLRGGRIHLADRRRTPEHRELVEEIAVSLREFSTRDDRREAQPALTVSGRWRGMTVSAEGRVAPFAQRRSFHLPTRIARADLGEVAGILPPGLVPPGLAGNAELAVDVRGQEGEGGWRVQADMKVKARRFTARPQTDLAVQGRSLRLEGEGHWTPRAIGFSRLGFEVVEGTVEIGGRLRASVDRLTARGQADLDHRGLLVPEMAVEATGLSLGRAGQAPAIRIGRVAAAGGTDQRAGTARLTRVRLADVNASALRQTDGSLDVAEWVGALPPRPEGETGETRPWYWEVLQLEVERADLDLTDRASGPERSLAVRNARLLLSGATSDATQPMTFELTASTSVARAIGLSGTWVRVPMQLVAKLAVQDADLPAVRAWLPAALPVETLSGRASLDLQAYVRSGQDGLAVNGSANARLQSARMVAEPLGSFAAEDLEVGLPRIQAVGRDMAGLTFETEGRIRARAVHARAQGYGVDSVAVAEAQAEVSGLMANGGPHGPAVELAGRVVLTQAEAQFTGIPIRVWRAAGLQVDLGQLRTAPLRLHVRAAEVDQPEVQVVRAGDGLPGAPGGAGVRVPPPIRLDRLEVRNGRVGFRDELVRPAWSAELTQVAGVIEGLQTDRDVPASFRVSAKETDGTQVRLHGRVRPVAWSGEVHAELENLDVLRPTPYLPDLVYRVVRGGTASGALDLSLRRNGQAFQVTGKGEVTFAPLELGDARRQLTLVLANRVQAQVDHFSLDPLAFRLSAIRLEEPWIAAGRDEGGNFPGLRLLSELRQAAGTAPDPAGQTPSLNIGQVTITDGIAEIEDRAVQPRFRDQVRNLEASVEGLSTEGPRKASVSLTGELSDRSTVSLKGFILPLPTNLYLDLEGEVRDFNLHRLNPYTIRVTSHRLEQGKLFTQVRYRVEQNRLEGDNLLYIDQLALGEQTEPVDRFEALVGVPLAVAVSLLQDPSGEIILRVPVHGELDRLEFDLEEVIATAIRNAVVQVITAPFQAVGQIFTLGGKIGAIEIAPVLFAPGSWALDDAARQHLRNLATVMRERPGMKVKLAGMAHVESDEDGLRAQKVEAELQRVTREPGVKSRDDALDRLFLRAVGASTTGLTREAKLARLKAAQKVAARDVEDLPDARTLSIYDYLAGTEGIERPRMFLAEGKVYRTAEGGGDWARRADFTILKP
jgi:uncharacterized protein involved in outer membrane biogenesis